jgi:hypothetical protein
MMCRYDVTMYCITYGHVVWYVYYCVPIPVPISINRWLTDSWQMWSLLKLMYLVQTKSVNVWRAMYEHRTA